MLTTQSIFDRYEEVRGRLPHIKTSEKTHDIKSLMDISSQIDAFIFDAFGVLNVGETLITGADRRLNELRERGCAIRILTNAASYDRSGAIEKFKRLGLELLADEIITSREAALAKTEAARWGIIAAEKDQLTDMPFQWLRLGDVAEDYEKVDSFLFLSTADWTDARQSLLTQSLARRPRQLLIGNADLAAPREEGFSVEPGHYGHLLADHFPEYVTFFGKPFADVYELIEATLPGIAKDRIAMCGDTLHTDILGAAARGWRTVLVSRDGLFAGHDTTLFCRASGIFPDWRLERI